MSILSDMLAELRRREAIDARKRTIPGLEPAPYLFRVGAWDAYVADMMRVGARYCVEAGKGEAFGAPVVRGGPIGFELVRGRP